MDLMWQNPLMRQNHWKSSNLKRVGYFMWSITQLNQDGHNNLTRMLILSLFDSIIQTEQFQKYARKGT